MVDWNFIYDTVEINYLPLSFPVDFGVFYRWNGEYRFLLKFKSTFLLYGWLEARIDRTAMRHADGLKNCLINHKTFEMYTMINVQGFASVYKMLFPSLGDWKTRVIRFRFRFQNYHDWLICIIYDIDSYYDALKNIPSLVSFIYEWLEIRSSQTFLGHIQRPDTVIDMFLVYDIDKIGGGSSFFG